MSRYLSGERRLAVLWGWTLYGYGPSRAEVLYPLAVRGASPGSAPVVGEVVEVDWLDSMVREAVDIETKAGYVPARVEVHRQVDTVDAIVFEWRHQDDDWIQDRIESGDWLTFQKVGR